MKRTSTGLLLIACFLVGTTLRALGAPESSSPLVFRPVITGEKELFPKDVTAFVEEVSLPEFTVYRFSQDLLIETYDLDEDGRDVWIGTNKGLLRFQTDTGKWLLYGESVEAPGIRIVCLVASSGMVFCDLARETRPGYATGLGVFQFDPRTLAWARLFRKGTWDLALDGSRLWSLPGGAETLDRQTGSQLQFGEESGLPGERAHGVFPQGNQIWFALMANPALEASPVPIGGGVARLFLAERRWEYFTVKDGLADNRCFDIIGDERELWVCHWEKQRGLSRFDRQTGKWSPVRLSHNRIEPGGTKLALDHRFLWVAQQGGLIRLDRESHEAVRFTQREGLPGFLVTGVTCGQDSVWAVAHSRSSREVPKAGLVRFRGKN